MSAAESPDPYEWGPPDLLEAEAGAVDELDHEPEPIYDDEPVVDLVVVSEDFDDLDVPASYTDAHVAEALAGHLRGRWLYVATSKRWYGWNGTRWAHDNTEQVYEVARRWVIAAVETVTRIGASSDDVKKMATYRNRRKLEDALAVARRIDGIAATIDEFDQDPNLLNTVSGVIDLRTGDVAPHDPAMRLSKLAPTRYDPTAYQPDVDKVLSAVDNDVRPYLKRLLGYAATGHTNEDVVAVMTGDGGNGKSVLLEALGLALGDYAGAASPQLVMKGAHDHHPNIKADLIGKRLVWVSETEEGGAFRMEQLKALTGGDQISARYMYGEFFTFTPTHTLVIATNHPPAVNSTERAAWRRLRLIPFPNTYKAAHEAGPGDKIRDPDLRRRIGGERQREALLAWVVAGAIEWNRDGLGHSATVDAATVQWRENEDVILRFIHDCIELDPDEETAGGRLYDTFTAWCRDEGRLAKSNKNFSQDFLAHEVIVAAGVQRVKRHNSAVYKGVKVRLLSTF